MYTHFTHWTKDFTLDTSTKIQARHFQGIPGATGLLVPQNTVLKTGPMSPGQVRPGLS